MVILLLPSCVRALASVSLHRGCGAGVVASDLGKEKTKCGTWQYWLVVGSILPVSLGITLLVRPKQMCTAGAL